MLKDISGRLPAYADIIHEVFSFHGGMNSKASQLFLGHEGKYALRKEQLPLLVNMIRTSSGAVETRPGREKLNASAVAPPAGDAVVRSIFEMRTAAGVNTIIINAGNTVYKWNGASFASVGTYTTSNLRIHWAQFKDVAIGTNGTDLLHRTDGTTLTAIAGSPAGAVALVAYRQRIFALKGRSLIYCALGDETDWTTPNNAGVLPIPTSLGGPGTGLLSLWDRLIIFTNQQVFQLVGTSPTDFSIEPINLQYGHELSPYGVIAAGNDIYFGSRRGCHALSVSFSQSITGDVTYDYISGVIEPTWQAINSGNFDNVVAVNDTQRSQVIFLCSRIGTTNGEALVADYYHLDTDSKPTWSNYSSMPFASGFEVNSLNNAKELLFGGYDGFVYRQIPTTTDTGSNIPVQLQYVTDLDLPIWDKLWRYLLIFTNARSGILQGSISYDFGQHVRGFSFDMTNPGGDLIGSSFVIGTSALGSVAYRQTRVGIAGHGRFATINIFANTPEKVTIGGFMFFAGLRRLISP
jgi:hypothetical protein